MSVKTDMSAGDLAGELVGHRIRAIDTERNAIRLDDGTVLTLADSSGCCAWFDVMLRPLVENLPEHVITAVEVASGDECPEDGSAEWTLTVLAADRRLVDIDINGSASSGYYVHSIALIVKPAASRSREAS